MAGEATVGSIIAYMRIDRAEWTRDRDIVKREAAALDGKNIKLTITADAARAITGIKAAALAQRAMNDQQDRSSRSASLARRNIGLLSTAIIGLGPAAIPAGAVVAGAMLGAVPAAGVLLLAVKGIQRELVTGTGQTKKYSGALKTLQTDMHGLEATAAAGVLRPFTGVVAMLHAQMPTLNREVAMFSTGLGQIAGNSATGLLAMFHQLNPLFVTFDHQLITGSQKFKAWATSSDSLRHFIAYAQTQLPTVENATGSLAVTIGHLIQAAAPFGSTTLQAITLFSRAINALPIGVLQTLVPLLAGLKLGSAAAAGFNNAAVGLGQIAARAKAAGGIAGGAAGTVGMLGKAVGFLGPVGLAAGLGLGALSIVMAHHQQAAVATTQRVNALTQAIENQQTAVGILAQLQGNGAVAAADKLGISQNTLVQSVLKGGAALAQVKTKIASTNVEYEKLGAYLSSTQAALDSTRNPKYFQSQAASQRELGAAMGTLSAKLQQAQADYTKAKQAAADYARSQGDATLAAQLESGAIQKVAASYGLTVDAYYNAKLASDKKTQSDQTQTAAMQLESDAAGLLTTKLDILNGKNLSVAQAQTGLAGANNQLLDSLKQNGRVIDGNTAAAVSNQQAVQSQVQMAQTAAEAIGKSTGSSAAAARSYLASRDALMQELQAHHLLTPALKAYIDRLYDLKDLKVPPTQVDLDKAAAEAKLAAYRRAIGQLPKGISTTVQVLGADHAKQVIRSVVDYANSQHPVIHVATINTSTGSVSSGRQVANADGGGVPEGWSTVGERGWEAVHKKGNTVQVFSHEKSRQLLPQGPSVPAFASGTGGSKAKPKPVYVPITVAADGGRAYGIDSYIKGQTPSAARAMHLLSLAVNDAFNLNGVMGKLAGVKADLANTRQAALQFRDTIINTRLGSIDPTAYGSASDLSAAYSSGSADNARYRAEFAKLKREGLTNSLLAQFTGPSTGLDALASASGTEIGQLNKSYAGFVGSTGAAGSAAANSLYGGRITQDQRAVTQLSAEVVKDRAALLAVGRALVQYTHRPLTVAIGNKEFLKTIEASGALQFLVDDLKRRLRL